MNKSIRLVIASLPFVGISGLAVAQATQEQLVGGWMLTSVVAEEAGKKTEPYGPSPMGYMTLGADGHYSIQLMRPDLPKIASNNRVKTTPQENAAIAEGLLSHFGGWKLVNPKTGEIAFHIKGSSFPNWIGTDQKRFMMVKDDSLTINNPTSPMGGTAVVAWKRVK